jgi:hypothetical protein
MQKLSSKTKMLARTNFFFFPNTSPFSHFFLMILVGIMGKISWFTQGSTFEAGCC